MIDHEYNYLLPFLQKTKSKIAVDVGCNEGSVTKKLIDLGFKTVSIEPNASSPELKEALSKIGGLDLYELAMSDRDGDAELNIGRHTLTSSLEDRWVTEAFPDSFDFLTKKKVKTVRLLPFLKEKGITEVGFLKVDAEGHDPKVLAGMFYERDVVPEIVMFECNRLYPDDLKFNLSLLRKIGYRKFTTFFNYGLDFLASFQYDGTFVPEFFYDCEKDFFTNTIAQ